jgi:hypothetical protein
VEFVRNVPCKDHQHPYVRVHLKSPTDNPEAEVFARLLTANSPGHPRLASVESTPFATWSPEHAAPEGLGCAERHAYLQSSGNTEPGQSSCKTCTTEYRCGWMEVAIATGSGGMTTRRVWVCGWTPLLCRPC